MIYISHRGNLSGPDKTIENLPEQIKKVLQSGYHCEIDVWKINNNFYLGHDEPQYQVDKKFLKTRNLWCHAKNIDALFELKKLNTNCFFHNTDDVTLTSKGYLWTYPGQQLTIDSIAVLPERVFNYNTQIAKGICTDYIYLYTQ